MRPIVFPIEMGDGTRVQVSGFPTPTPGLVVHHRVAPTCLPSEDGEDCWMVTHARTGLGFSFCWGSPEGALAFAEEIGSLTDWQQAADGISRSMKGRGRVVRAAAERLGSRPHPLSRRATDRPVLDNGVIA